MRLAKPTGKVIAALAWMIWLAPEAATQAKQPAKRAQAGKAPAAAATQPAQPQPQPPAPLRRRDPFLPLIARGGPGGAGGEVQEALPPGKAGLVVGTLRVDGLVRAPNGMIAVVTNPQQRVYFIREGDRLYNGQVERITMESVTFRERGRDPFGNPLDRLITKRLYPIVGE